MQSFPPGRDPIPMTKAPVPPAPVQQIVNAPAVPTFYTDRCDVEPSAWGVTLVYMESVPLSKGVVKPTAAVRMSWEHFKIMTMLAKRLIKAHEEQTLGGKRVVIPKEILDNLGLDGEQW